MYAGLTTADKGALLKAKECGGSTYSRWATIGDKWVRELTVNIDLALAQIEEMESAEKPRTNRDVLLERWAKDTEAMASTLVSEKTFQGITSYYPKHGKQSFSSRKDAVEREIAYLNSAAEVGK